MANWQREIRARRTRVEAHGPREDAPMSRRAALGVLGALTGLGGVASAATTSQTGGTSRKMQQDALRSIPFSKLKDETQQRILDVVKRPTLFRRLPVQVVDCDPELYLCLVRHPEIIVNIWELMGITNVQLKRTGDYTFDADDGAGTESHVELVYGDRRMHLLYGSGGYQGPLFGRAIKGKCVLILQSGYSQAGDQRHYVSHRLDVFLRLENIGADLVARTLHPLVGKTADHNFAESTQFLSQISYAAQNKPQSLFRMIQRLDKVAPQVRDKFAEIAASVSRNAAATALKVDQETKPTGVEPTPESTRRAARLKRHSTGPRLRR